MLRIALAGLVLNKVMTLEEAERLDSILGDRVVPGSVAGCVEMIEETKKELSKEKEDL